MFAEGNVYLLPQLQWRQCSSHTGQEERYPLSQFKKVTLMNKRKQGAFLFSFTHGQGR